MGLALAPCPGSLSQLEATQSMAAATAAGGPTEPQDIETKSAVFDIAFHPTQDVIAVGLIDGSLELCVGSRCGT